jgi:hypothetical protein
MKLLIYVPIISPRIKYIFSFIFNDILRAEIDFTINKVEFLQSNLPKISYAEQPVGNELFFKSKHLLFEHKILAQQIKITDFGEMKVPFSVSKSTLPFDIFAASFYFLSRHEEYIYHERKNGEPYPFKDSLQYQLELLKTPIIDNWALILKNILLKHFPHLAFGAKQFSFKPIFINHSHKNTKRNFITNTTTYIKTLIDNKLHAKKDKVAAIKHIINHNNDFVEVPAVNGIGVHNNQHFIAQLQIPKSYIKLMKNIVKSDYSMCYPDFSGFRAGTCTSFYWYDLQLEKKTRLLLHPVVTTDLNLLKNKTPEALLLQMNELISGTKLVNGDLYFLSLSNDIRPQ